MGAKAPEKRYITMEPGEELFAYKEAVAQAAQQARTFDSPMLILEVVGYVSSPPRPPRNEGCEDFKEVWPSAS